MNWFEELWHVMLPPFLKFFAWLTLLVALWGEILYLHQYHLGYMVLVIAALVYLLFIEPLLSIPYIYFVKESGLFLYANGSQRIAFDYVMLAKSDDNGALFGGINGLNIARPPLSENDSHLVFDKENSAIAIIKHHAGYTENQADAKIILVRPDGSKTRMRIGSFIEQQAQMLHEARATIAEKK